MSNDVKQRHLGVGIWLIDGKGPFCDNRFMSCFKFSVVYQSIMEDDYLLVEWISQFSHYDNASLILLRISPEGIRSKLRRIEAE